MYKEMYADFLFGDVKPLDKDTPKVENFLNDIEAVYRKHGLAISHEDRHGGFEIVEFNEEYLAWLWGTLYVRAS